MSNFIERNLVGKAGKRGTKLEELLAAQARDRERGARRAEQEEETQEEAQEEQGPTGLRRGLPAGLAFRRKLNH